MKKTAKRTGSKCPSLLLMVMLLLVKHNEDGWWVCCAIHFCCSSWINSNNWAKPVFVDIKRDYNIDENKIERAITKKTKAIIPVHWAGRPCEMSKIYSIAKKYKLHIIQDSAHVIGASYKKKFLVNFGDACTYSMHPLKNLNVWGDGGFIVTNKKLLAKKLYLIRNHGLKNRDNVEVFGFNSRLDTIQAAVANYKMKNKLDNITIKRIRNATNLINLSANKMRLLLKGWNI